MSRLRRRALRRRRPFGQSLLSLLCLSSLCLCLSLSPIASLHHETHKFGRPVVYTEEALRSLKRTRLHKILAELRGWDVARVERLRRKQEALVGLILKEQQKATAPSYAPAIANVMGSLNGLLEMVGAPATPAVAAQAQPAQAQGERRRS